MRYLYFVILSPLGASGCNSTEQCRYPYNNPYTTNLSVTKDDCCMVMPFIPLLDTGVGDLAKVVAPPSMNIQGTICPKWASDVVIAQGLNPWRNGSLYPRTKVFFVGGLDGSGSEGHDVPKSGLSACAKPHPFYTKYLLARAHGTEVTDGIPIIGSEKAPNAALITAGATIGEMLRQMDLKIPGIRQAMVQHAQRFAVWADAERRFDTCDKCKKLDPTFDCGAHIDSRAGRDTSYHPEVPECQEGGGAGKDLPTTFTEEYGIPYLEPNGTVRDSYCGTNIVAHEFFHSIHQVGIKTVDYQLYLDIEQAAARATSEGIYVHHPGAKDDGCNSDFVECVAYEFIVKAHMTWNGFPADKREFLYQSRREMKIKAPWIAQLVFRLFEDGNWNPAQGAVITTPRDQTFGLSCETAPGSALCGKPLSEQYIGPPMEEILSKCGGDCRNALTEMYGKNELILI